MLRDAREKRKSLRETMLQQRLALIPEEVTAASEAIAGKLNELMPLARAKNIMGFWAIKNEVDLSGFLKDQSNQGKTILLPRINPQKELEAIAYRGDQWLTRGSFGIPEPVGEAFPADDIDAILVPGLVFDGRGYRLGYGKGYYDRFLAHIREDAFICGVCYEFQVVDDVFPHEKDVPLHWIVTDKSELVLDWDFF